VNDTFGSWTPLIVLVVTFLALFWLKRRITNSLQELSVRLVDDPDVALIIYFVVVLPGVIIHELSHWLTAKLLGVRVSFPAFGPVRKGRSNRVSLGSVRVSKVDPVRASLIGVAPLLGGSAVILIIGNLVLGVGDFADAVTGQGVAGVLGALAQMAEVGDFWLWLYLIFAVSNAMLPSESDMTAVRPVLIFLGIVTAVVLVVTGVRGISPAVVDGVSAIAGYLATAFGLTLAVDVVFMLVIWLVLLPTRWLQGADLWSGT
jgi:hypothetical protein